MINKKITFLFLFISLFYNVIFCKKSSVLVVYGVPKKIPNVNWNDGFVAAMTLLEEKYDVSWCTPIDLKTKKINQADYEAVLVKSSWNTPTDKFARSFFSRSKPIALLISNTNKPPKGSHFTFYKVIFYETNWYGRFVKHHPCAIRAFGINMNIMKAPQEHVEKIYDYILVGDFKYAKTKRHLKMLNKTGNRLVVGSIDGGGNSRVKSQLINAGVNVINGVSPQELAQLYYQSKICYLPSTIAGGSDRSVLEARSCGVNVEIASDNPKLKELVQGPILDHYYYAEQLDKGIRVLLNKME